MKRKHLGHTDIKISALCLGTMYFGTKVSKTNAFRVLDGYLDAGGNFIDTANNYAYWVGGTGDESELLIGDWLQYKKRDEVVLASKIGAKPIGYRNGEPVLEGLNKATIIKSVENSLKRLRCEYLDLCYIHADLQEYPLQERLESFQLLANQGKIRSKGISNTTTERYQHSCANNQLQNWSQFQAIQQKFSYLLPYRIDESDILKFADEPLIKSAEERQQSLLVYSVLLSGAYEKGFRDLPRVYQSKKNFERFTWLGRQSELMGCSRSQWVLLWLLKKSTALVPIIAASNIHQLTQNIQSLDFTRRFDELLNEFKVPMTEGASS